MSNWSNVSSVSLFPEPPPEAREEERRCADKPRRMNVKKRERESVMIRKMGMIGLAIVSSG